MVSTAASHGEADLEQKLLKVEAPPEGSSHLAFLPVPTKPMLFPRFVVVVVVVVVVGSKLGFLANLPPNLGKLPWPQLGFMTSLEICPAEAGWGSNMAIVVSLVDLGFPI